MNKDQCFNLGYVVKSIGLKGECSIYLDVDDAYRYKELESVFIEINNQLIPFFISNINIKQNNFASIKFKQINSIDEIQQIKGCQIYLPLSFLPELDEKSFYYHEIINFQIIDDCAGKIGVINEVQDWGNNVLVVCFNERNKEILIPLQKIFIKSVDRKNKTIFTCLPEGLVDVYLNTNPIEDKDT